MTSQEIKEKMKEAEEKIQKAISEYRSQMSDLIKEAETEKIERLRNELTQ